MIGTPASRNLRGFTLLEVLVAIAVLGIALGAIIAAGGRYANTVGSLHTKTLALWVAHNRLTEIALSPQWPDTGKSDDNVKMGGRQWTWHVKVSSTSDPSLRRVDIHVTPEGKNDESKASLTAFLSAYGRQNGGTADVGAP